MEHLHDYLGNIGISVDCEDRRGWRNCCLLERRDSLERPFPHCHEYHEFFTFPVEHGWEVDSTTYKLEKKPDGQPSVDANAFFQLWLFFCLLNVVVRTDKPLLHMAELVEISDEGQGDPYALITTKKLESKLTDWHDWIRAHPAKARLRLIQTDLVLEYARQVVRANLDAGVNDYDIRPGISLSVMILGETLSAVKTNTMRAMGESIHGWESDDLEGWGYPQHVIDELERDENGDSLCLYTKCALKTQIGPNATLLLATLRHLPGNRRHGRRYDCTETECKFIDAASTGHRYAGSRTTNNKNQEVNGTGNSYTPRCDCLPINRVDCEPVGPDMTAVYDAIRKAHSQGEVTEFPIFGFRESKGSLRVIVETWQPGRRGREFATISHVWSQGLGNEMTNTISRCQLKFIKDLLDRVSESQSGIKSPIRYFWLDTFAVPVAGADKPEDFEDLKQKAIRDIYHAFDKSNHCLVIDRDLCGTVQNYEKLNLVFAVKLLTSVWMRRLWTLQEAFLSRTMCAPYKGNIGGLPPNRYPGKGFDKFIEQLSAGTEGGRPKTILEISLAGVLKRHLFENLMGSGREARNQTGDPVRGMMSDLIASAWRSARWRGTSRKEDETIILATLLKLDFRDTEMAQLGGMIRYEDSAKEEAAKQRQKMMRNFLQLVEKHYPGSIPAGIIFLPPERLGLPGFGWAPTTWASRVTEHYPYPLSGTSHPTEIKPEGLLVRYPGIVLHSESLDTILKCLADIPDPVQIKFPVGRDLHEWYEFQITDKGKHAKRKDIGKKPGKVAVIMSRPRPKGRTPEIGLLVEIYDSLKIRQQRQGRDEILSYARIISRIGVSRTEREPFLSAEDQVIGELTSEDQLWCVDDFASNVARFQEFEKKKNERRSKAPGAGNSQESPNPALRLVTTISNFTRLII